MSDYETLLVRTLHAVMTVTLSDPPINLETDAMMADLDRLVALLEADRETKVVVFRSDAPGYFMAHFWKEIQLPEVQERITSGFCANFRVNTMALLHLARRLAPAIRCAALVGAKLGVHVVYMMIDAVIDVPPRPLSLVFQRRNSSLWRTLVGNGPSTSGGW